MPSKSYAVLVSQTNPQLTQCLKKNKIGSTKDTFKFVSFATFLKFLKDVVFDTSDNMEWPNSYRREMLDEVLGLFTTDSARKDGRFMPDKKDGCIILLHSKPPGNVYQGMSHTEKNNYA